MNHLNNTPVDKQEKEMQRLSPNLDTPIPLSTEVSMQLLFVLFLSTKRNY